MSDSATAEKRMPGIPDRTLEKIVSEAGGTLAPYFDGRKPRISLVLGDRIFDAANNTELLTLALRAVAGNEDH
jgi:hypothetical protein